MRRSALIGIGLACTHLLAACAPAPAAADRAGRQVSEGMRKATEFMMGRVASHGGFVWYYTADLKERWGEVVARDSHIWIEPPGTPTVGLVLLEAFEATRDPFYTTSAATVGRAIVAAQHRSGGWQYYYDFEAGGAQAWRDMIAKTHWGWEEYYYQYDNATFDDNTTAGAATFLLRLYDATKDEAFKAPLLAALSFVLDAQSPNGAWPQRHPRAPALLEGGDARYTGHFTYNDGVTHNNIVLLLQAATRLGDDRYRQAAIRGMDFYLLSQGKPPQAGWAQQYDAALKPAPARTYEPAALNVTQTLENIRALQEFYQITGDRKYLDAVPAAIDWLERSALNTGLPAGKTHAVFYALGSNAPLWVYRTGTSRFDQRTWFDSTLREKDWYPYGRPQTIDVPALRAELARVSAQSPAEARAAYERAREVRPSVTTEQAVALVRALDERGAWLSDVSILDPAEFIKNPPRTFRGIATKTYIDHMRTLAAYEAGQRAPR